MTEPGFPSEGWSTAGKVLVGAAAVVVGLVLFGLVTAAIGGFELFTHMDEGLHQHDPLTALDWCKVQHDQRPFLSMVNKAIVGGDAFPTEDARKFVNTNGRIVQPPPEVFVDAKTVHDALFPGTAYVTGPRVPHRIPPSRAGLVQASALRLDAHCMREDEQLNPTTTTR